MKQLDISNKTLRELAYIGVVGAYSEANHSIGIVWKNALVTHIKTLNG
jgi:hypothetical protein